MFRHIYQSHDQAKPLQKYIKKKMFQFQCGGDISHLTTVFLHTIVSSLTLRLQCSVYYVTLHIGYNYVKLIKF